MLLAYEIGITVLFVCVLAWTIRSQNPIFVGAIIGGFLMSSFDWLWCSRGFWNATIAPSLTMIPGLNIQGVQYPFSICFVWAIGFGFLPLFVSRFHDKIGDALGWLHLPVILFCAALIDLAIEGIGVSVLGAWTYHQAPQYLIFGMPWSNFWFLGGVITAAYFILARLKNWAPIPDKAGLSLARESTWMGLFLGASAILIPAFLLGTLQLFWWSATHPWVESGRPF
ncbi:MAG: hypothetical protein ABWZ40_09260 [Caulobacterales bacterium]